MSRIVIGTRGSALARVQTQMIAGELRRVGATEVEIRVISTRGDRIQDVPLARVGGKGLFVKEIEAALLEGSVDLAVHSLKDMPSELPEGLVLGAVPEREDPRDTLVLRSDARELSPDAVVGTSSLRRAAQLRARWPDLRILPLRGNVDTRIRKLEEGDGGERLDAIVLALAGLRRLGRTEGLRLRPLDPESFVPAVGQGALAIECRGDDPRVLDLLARIHHEPTACGVAVERAFLAGVEGSCQIPVAAHAHLASDGALEARALIASLDGRDVLRCDRRGSASDAEEMGRALATELLDRGGRAVLQACLEAFAAGGG